MLILALDTTTRGGSVAVTNDDRLLALVPGNDARTHGERLPEELATALEQAGVARGDLDLLAVATGPGAFTGLRIGLATIQGLAMALHRPVAGISALDALAWQMRDEPVGFLVPWMDAQRGDAVAAIYRTGRAFLSAEARGAKAEGLPVASTPLALLEKWRDQLGGHSAVFAGDAVVRDADLIARVGQGRWRTVTHAPLAPAIAALARQQALAGLAGPPHALEPIYVRRPDPEIERERQGKPKGWPPPTPTS
ncbi:MAG: tRNA (adenosine(37)-N6)-threonylcarbamoyltransferase complex dimerization subunit type 1 TsaB [Vicinamibacterales bacterium]